MSPRRYGQSKIYADESKKRWACRRGETELATYGWHRFGMAPREVWKDLVADVRACNPDVQG